ncbi:MAG TPA: hypothetical protein ENO05_04390 [Bacteroides sp.]|nr:hypothetical protein [Bacteroides sp.]
MKKLFLIPIGMLVLTACPYGYRYDTGHFQESVTNFGEVNSQYDDYNMTAPFIYYRYLLRFSSNRNSHGGEFDIVGENMFIDWDKDDGTLAIGTDPADDNFDYLYPMFDSVNTSFNELGPYALAYSQYPNDYEVLWTDLMMYASDSGGNFDIKFIYSELKYSGDTTTTKIFKPEKIAFLNSEANELYPAFFGTDLCFPDEWAANYTENIEKILYCSDKEGDFDIYEVSVPSDPDVISTLMSDLPHEPVRSSLNSDSDDKCPFANGRLLVFASDRPGGFGGFDLYYSIFKDGDWSDPKNFGEEINSSYDDYRPITMRYHDFDNTLLMFSSNRPGGKGGFDLYYSGIDP